MRRHPSSFVTFLAVVGAASVASAHPGHGPTDITAGAVHPLTGLDHLLAMLTVGLLAARLGGRALWLLPTLFVTAMLAGGAAALIPSVPAVPAVEQLIAASVVVIGLMLVAAGRAPASLAYAAVPAFALFHGYAHVVEGVVDEGTHGAIGYGLGMAVSSAVLHGVGIAAGLSLRGRATLPVWRVAGTAVATVGLVLLVRAF